MLLEDNPSTNLKKTGCFFENKYKRFRVRVRFRVREGKGGKQKSILLYRNMQLAIMRPQTPTKLLFISSVSSINHSTCTLLSPLMRILRPLVTPPERESLVPAKWCTQPSFYCTVEYVVTPWELLTEKDKDHLNLLSTFLHGSKEFINPVALSRHSWGGSFNLPLCALSSQIPL
ncbi:hypothetical protein VP01_5845g2 [Puccinia sorghi]|uniref:Uncharacterized protein n=1 Tax=Puccinia sorghi TaxID=27349 RepID=A0A0L6UK49_9BASI|nr:hypothetical protein VP01_5845g2 [Puccinia sorghi]